MEVLDNLTIQRNGTYCSIWYAQLASVKHSCAYYFCNDWVKNWAKTSISSRGLASGESLRCLNNACDQPISYEQMRNFFSNQEMEGINEMYNDNYFSNTKDIARCPSQACDYVGVIDLRACRDNLKCAKCEYEWRDPTQMSFTENVYKSLKDTLNFNPEFFNYLNEIFLSNPCPQWGMKIYKLEGCAHMVCQKWQYEFCWLWFDHYPSYVHKGYSIWGLRVFLMISSVIMAFIMLMNYSIYSDTIIGMIFRAILSGTGKFIVSNIAALSIFLNLAFALSYAEAVNNYYSSAWKKFTLGILVLTYPMLWGLVMYNAYYSKRFSFIPTYIYYELIIILAIVALVIAIFICFLIGKYLILGLLGFIIRKSIGVATGVRNRVFRQKMKSA